MNLLAYLESRSREERHDFLGKLVRDGVRYCAHHVRNCATGRRTASPALALLIERHSGGKVQRWELRPDIWQRPAPLKTNGKRRARAA